MAKRVTGKTIGLTLRRFADWCDQQDSNDLAGVTDPINNLLDMLRDEDAFGTEGQCDPRGDARGD
jgi:hypothetical protein